MRLRVFLGLTFLSLIAGCSDSIETNPSDVCVEALPVAIGRVCASQVDCHNEFPCVEWRCIENRCRSDTASFNGQACFNCGVDGTCNGGICK